MHSHPAVQPPFAAPAAWLFRRIRALSLDVAAGALAGGLMASAALRAPMPAAWYFVLPLAVWIIYTADHLLDARRIAARGSPSSFRHRFHYRNFRALAVIWLAASAVCAAVILLGLPREILFCGAALGCFAVFHLAFAQWTRFLYFPRELSVALIYTAGVWFAPLALSPQLQSSNAGVAPAALLAYGPEPRALVMLTLFFFAAFANLIAFSIFEQEADAREAPNSLVQRLGEGRSAGLLWILAGLAPAGALWLFFRAIEFLIFGGRALLDEALLVGVSGLLLAFAAAAPLLVYLSRERFQQSEAYRGLLDGVFLLYALPWALWVCF